MNRAARRAMSVGPDRRRRRALLAEVDRHMRVALADLAADPTPERREGVRQWARRFRTDAVAATNRGDHATAAELTARAGRLEDAASVA